MPVFTRRDNLTPKVMADKRLFPSRCLCADFSRVLCPYQNAAYHAGEVSILPRYSGFVNTLERNSSARRPRPYCVCFDPPGQTFRNEAFDEYKGRTQCATPEDIKLSVPVIKEIVRAYNIPIVEVEGFEADDVIGTLARCAEKKGFTVYMMTPDKDFRSACEPLPCFSTSHPTARQRFRIAGRGGGVRPLWHRACFTGDRSAGTDGHDKVDNIPGCPGVGEKTRR